MSDAPIQYQYRLEPGEAWTFQVHYQWEFFSQEESKPERTESLDCEGRVRLRCRAPVREGLLRLDATLDDVRSKKGTPGAPAPTNGDTGHLEMSRGGNCIRLEAKQAGELFVSPFYVVFPSQPISEWEEDVLFFLPGLVEGTSFPVKYQVDGASTRLGLSCTDIVGGCERQSGGSEMRIQGRWSFAAERGEPLLSDVEISIVRSLPDRTSRISARLKAELQPASSLVEADGFLLA